MYMYICIYVCMFTYTHIQHHLQTSYTRLFPRSRYLYICICMIIHTYTHTHAHSQAHAICIYVYTRSYVHTYIHTLILTLTRMLFVYTYIHDHTYTQYIHTHTHIHVYIYTYTNILTLSLRSYSPCTGPYAPSSTPSGTQHCSTWAQSYTHYISGAAASHTLRQSYRSMHTAQSPSASHALPQPCPWYPTQFAKPVPSPGVTYSACPYPYGNTNS